MKKIRGALSSRIASATTKSTLAESHSHSHSQSELAQSLLHECAAAQVPQVLLHIVIITIISSRVAGQRLIVCFGLARSLPRIECKIGAHSQRNDFDSSEEWREARVKSRESLAQSAIHLKEFTYQQQIPTAPAFRQQQQQQQQHRLLLPSTSTALWMCLNVAAKCINQFHVFLSARPARFECFANDAASTPASASGDALRMSGIINFEDHKQLLMKLLSASS